MIAVHVPKLLLATMTKCCQPFPRGLPLAVLASTEYANEFFQQIHTFIHIQQMQRWLDRYIYTGSQHLNS